MSALLCVRTALRALGARPLRSTLAMLGIVMGVGSLIAMISVGAGAQQRVAEQLRGLGGNLLIIVPGSVTVGGVRAGFGSRPTITQGDASSILSEVAGIEAAAPSVRGNGQVVWGNANWTTLIQGTLPMYEDARRWSVVSGRYFTQDELERAAKVALLGQTVVDHLFGNSDPLGQVVRLKGVPVTVIGVLEHKGQTAWGQDQDDAVIIPITTANKRVLGPTHPLPTSVDVISVRVSDGHDVKTAEQDIRRLLRQRHRLQPHQPDDFWLRNLSEMAQAEAESSRALTLLLAAVASVSLVVGGIGIMNIMLVSVTERTREIGLRMAVGARGRDIRVQFVLEAIALSLVGGVTGVAAGLGAVWAIASLARWRTVVEAPAIALALGAAAGVGIFFGYYPAARAARLTPIEALRHE